MTPALRRHIGAALIPWLALVGCSPSPSPDPTVSARELYPVRENGKWGFIDAEGHVVIPFQYADAGPFREGAARTDKAFIDSNGKTVINMEPLLQRGIGATGDFSSGRVVVKAFKPTGYIENIGMLAGRGAAPEYGVMDKTGQVKMLPQYQRIGAFHEGLAVADAAIINVEGTVVLNTQPLGVKPWECGEDLCAVSGVAGGYSLWGFVDVSGKMVIPLQFHQAHRFSEGLAGVSVLVGRRQQWGYVDKAGQYVIPSQFDEVDAFHDGLAAVKIDERWGFIDRAGTRVIEPLYDQQPGPFSGGLAKIIIGETIGYIKKNGQWAWQPKT